MVRLLVQTKTRIHHRKKGYIRLAISSEDMTTICEEATEIGGCNKNISKKYAEVRGDQHVGQYGSICRMQFLFHTCGGECDSLQTAPSSGIFRDNRISEEIE